MEVFVNNIHLVLIEAGYCVLAGGQSAVSGDPSDHVDTLGGGGHELDVLRQLEIVPHQRIFRAQYHLILILGQVRGHLLQPHQVGELRQLGVAPRVVRLDEVGHGGLHVGVGGVGEARLGAGVVHLLHGLEGGLAVDTEHVSVQVESSVGCVITEFAAETEVKSVLLQDPAHQSFVVNIFYMTVQVCLTGQFLATFRARKLQVQVHTCLMHLQIAFLVSLVIAIFIITVKLTCVGGRLFMTFSSLQVFNVMSSKLSVVIETLPTFLTTVFLGVVVNYLNMLGQITKLLTAEWTGLFII